MFGVSGWTSDDLMRNVYMVDGPQMPQMIVLIGMSQQYWQIGY